ncbi:zinc finger BED domain-containing protein RICESLEEPER 2-like [Senna tora]|uniref:Zinc finger BED domain-containing protein RICESLEEPER 2-like n=1 Tax=Senna tora TaxID=362788 RepID=A0A834TRV7_9FABA|nr:zinc finger BED domain-containing protein RICESLEEPER 2-like [Senna tora]
MASLESKSATKEIMEDEYAEYETKERIDDEYAENDQSKKRKCMTSKVPLGSTKVEDELNDATSDLSITSIGESPTSTKWEEIRKAVSTFLVCANLPFGTVESPAFRDMLQTLSPECKTLSQHAAKRLVMTDYLNESNFVLDELGEASGKISLTSDYWRAEHTHDECMCLSQLMMNTLSQHAAKRFVMADYLNERDFVLNELGEAPGKISLTSDYWRTEHTHDEYMCITAHWIDKDWKKQKRIIYFKAIELPFSGNSLADEVAMCLSEWKIDEKVCSITLDSSTNNDGMATCLKLKSSIHKGLFRDGMFFQVRCCRDILNCIVQAALEKVDNIVTKIRNGVKYLKKSTPRRKEFYDMAEKIFHLDTSRKLKTDMCLRWNSTYLMLEHGIYYQKVFQLWGQKDDTFGMFVLSDEEWKKIEAVHKFL